MVLHHLQPSFTGGEISPSLQARTDASSYHTWLKYAQNMWVHPQGGISNRPGTQYVARAKYDDKPCMLYSFPISADECYILEAGEKYFRFYTAGGAVLDATQTPLEIATPYTAQEAQHLCMAQYNQTLYVAHPNHPLGCLTRTALGQFTWAQAPLGYGPFKPENTDETHRMRVYEQTTTVQTEGVAATLAFEPVNDSNLFNWAYFNGTCFYAATGYGLRLDEIITYFNDAYGAQGLRASRQGNILKITSAVATGGDWNGATFMLEYRSRFNGSADMTVTQTLSGGENAGMQTVSQPGQYVLESSADFFTPLHVGGKFCLVHTVDGQQKSGTLGYESVSAYIASGSDWTLRTSGTWTGTLQVDVSRDLGQTWSTLKVLSRASGEDNLYLAGNLADPENLFYVRVRSCQISGEAGYELTADAFIQRGVLDVIGYVSPTQLLVRAERAFGSSEWTSHWAQGSFSPAAGYPGCVFFFQDRLGLAATREEVQTLWFSKTGKPHDFGTARQDMLPTDSFSVRLGGTKLSNICSVLVANRLLIFTSGSVWTLQPNGVLSLDTLELAQQNECGAARMPALLAENRAVFVSSQGASVRDLAYDYATASYRGDELTLRAKHLFVNKTITQLAYSAQPDPLLWCVRSDGKLCTLTYIPEQGIYAWTHQQTQGRVQSVCVSGREEVWLLVQRAGGNYVEKLSPRLASLQVQDQVFLDSCISFHGEQPQTQLSGLAHLEGQHVSALADGNVVTGLRVENGCVTLPFAARVVQVGLAYQSKLGTLPLAGTWPAQKQRLISAVVKIENSRGGKVGTDEEHLTEWVQRTHEPYNSPISLQTTDVVVALKGRSQAGPGVWVVQDDPLPLTVLAIGVSAA